MRSRAAVLVVLVGALSVHLAGAARQPQVASGLTGSIAGRVVDGSSGSPVGGTIVDVVRLNGGHTTYSFFGSGCPKTDDQFVARLTADAEGRFGIGGLAPGAYQVITRAPGFSPGRHGQRSWSGPDRWIVAAAGTVTDAGDVPIWRDAVIAGYVLGVGGTPMADVDVDVQPADPIWIRQIRSVRTNPRGQFTLSVPPGRYFVRASRARQVETTSGPDLTTKRGPAVYRTTYFPRAVLVRDATAVSLASGQVREGLIIDLRATSAFQVLVALDAAGTVGHVELRDSRGREISRRFVEPHWNNETSRVLFANVPAGRYTVVAELMNAGEGVVGSASLDILNRNVELRVPVGAGARISGRVQYAGVSRRPTLKELNQRLAPLCDAPDQRSLWSAEPPTAIVLPQFGDDDRFLTRGLTPGRYAMAEPMVDGWFMHAVMLNNLDVTDLGFEVGAQDLIDAGLVLTDRLARLRGRVTPLSAEARVRPWITIFPAEPELWGPPSLGTPAARRIRFLRTGTAGTFAAELPPGNYLVVATDSETAPIRSAGQFAHLAKFATAVQVTASDVPVEVAVRVQLWSQDWR